MRAKTMMALSVSSLFIMSSDVSLSLEATHFCMKKIGSDDFLSGCKLSSAPNAATPETTCQHPTSGVKGKSFKIEHPWVKVPAGEGDCPQNFPSSRREILPASPYTQR